MSRHTVVPLSDEQRKLIEKYLGDNGWDKIKTCIRKTLKKNPSPQEMEDYLEVAYEALIKAAKRFRKDKPMQFSTFVYMNVSSSIKTYLTHMHRDKRVLKDNKGRPIYDTSIDALIGEDGIKTVEDTIQSEFDMDSVLSNCNGYGYSETIEEFLDILSELPRKIVELIMEGYSSIEIKDQLGITDKQYRDSWKIINSYENKRILYKEYDKENEEVMNKIFSSEDVAETYKNTSYSIESISKQLQKKRIRDDHILQRYSGQWQGFAKSELVSDILRGKSLTQIIISEEIKDGLRMQWLIDGKQRCTTLDDYLHDGFKISNKTKNYLIKYQTTKIDENGCELLNEDGFTEMEIKEFDIRGKKFSQLPEELQEIFKDRQIPVLYNMNCTKQDIADDIARFNRSRPMNKAQNGWLGLDEYFAEFVENIAKMKFFQPDFEGSSYTKNNHTSGAIRRNIVEGIMIADFIEGFNKEFDKMCEFLSDEASDSNFTIFYCLIDRLTSVCNKEVAHMFNITESFLWFGLFSKFIGLGIDDNKFVDFMIEFDKNLRMKKSDGISFKDLCINETTGKSRSSKDKNTVIKKLELLEKFMLDYLHIKSDDLKEIDILDLIKENINSEANEEDVKLYELMLNDYTVEIPENAVVLSDKNKTLLVAMVAYACKHETDDKLGDWLVEFTEKNKNTYYSNSKFIFEYMRDDFDKFIDKEINNVDKHVQEEG